MIDEMFSPFLWKFNVRISRYSDDQIERAVGRAEAGVDSVADIVDELGISEATFCTWKKRMSVLGTPEIMQLRDENARLNKFVADLTRARQACFPCSEKRGRR
jgi:putative transposase